MRVVSLVAPLVGNDNDRSAAFSCRRNRSRTKQDLFAPVVDTHT